MQKTEQNSRIERENIVEWILTLEQRRMLLESNFDRLNRTILQMINSFVQEYGINEDDTWSIMRRKVSTREIRAFQNEVELLMREELTDEAKAEANKVSVNRDTELIDSLIAMVTIETIRVMNQVDSEITLLIRSTIEQELTRQQTLIGLPRQYVVNHIDDIYKSALTQHNWSANIWGLQQNDLRNNVERLVRESLLRGYNPKKIAKEVRDITNRTRYETERLMRTEQARVHGQSQLEAYQAQNIQLFDLIPEPSACDKCKAVASNNPHLVQEAVVGVNVQPIHPNCRCSTVGVLD